MRGPTRVPLELSAEESSTLQMWVAAGTTQQRLVRRARVILDFVAGVPWRTIAVRAHLTKNRAQGWLRRFRAARLAGLQDRPRAGRKLVITPAQRAQVLALACAKPDDGCSHYTRRALARVTGLSVGAVQGILTQGDLQPHKVDYWCGKSPDPEFAAKEAAVVGLYLHPPANAVVISVDEKTQIQALDRTQPELPLRPGQPRRQTATYRRHGTVCLLAALAVHQGKVQARVVPRNDAEHFLAFLKSLYRAHPGKELHVIMDNLGVHKAQIIKDWVARRRRLHLHFTPTYASWLNQIEIWFHLLSRDVLKGAIWHSRAELVAQIMRYIETYNQQRAHPFKWTYTGRPMEV